MEVGLGGMAAGEVVALEIGAERFHSLADQGSIVPHAAYGRREAGDEVNEQRHANWIYESKRYYARGPCEQWVAVIVRCKC